MTKLQFSLLKKCITGDQLLQLGPIFNFHSHTCHFRKFSATHFSIFCFAFIIIVCLSFLFLFFISVSVEERLSLKGSILCCTLSSGAAVYYLFSGSQGQQGLS